MFKNFIQFFISYVICYEIIVITGKVIIPKISDVVKPQIPDDLETDEDILNQLNYNSDPEITPGLFQGDMAMDDSVYKYWRVGLRGDTFPDRLWPNRTVPYAISPLYEIDDHATILTAIRTIKFMTCIKFVPWNGRDKDFLLIWPIKYPKGCWSFVGKVGGAQILSLQPPDSNSAHCLGTEGRAIHELMHALGIFHEQSRADRDRFVTINWDNIVPAYKSNFDKQSLENTTYNFEYDYESIMHYGKGFFSKTKGLETITPKHAGVKLGQRRGLSKTDCLKINDLYKCLDDVKLSKKYYTICRILGL